MKNLSVHIGERTLIDALDYVVHRGDKLVIAGPNGAGKSTLLKLLTHVTDPHLPAILTCMAASPRCSRSAPASTPR